MRSHAQLLWIVGCVFLGCGPRSSAPEGETEAVVMFAAASTKEPIEQAARDFQRENGTRVEVSLGPSSGLAKQIEFGALADLFLSADEASADYLTQKQFVSERCDLLTNQLVIVVPTASDLKIRELRDLAGPQIHRLALAEVKVPAGEYARQALRKAGVWNEVQNRVVGGIDVRATLWFVVQREAEAGLVYRTDALHEPRVRVAVEVEPGLHEPIRYPLVLLRRERRTEAARRFYDYLGSPKAAGVFERAGFGVAR